MSTEVVRVLILNENEHKNEELFRLKKGISKHGCFSLKNFSIEGSTIQIVVSSRLAWRNVRVLTNIAEEFSRSTYHELEWISPSAAKSDDSNRYAMIRCSKPGVFHYYFTIDGTT